MTVCALYADGKSIARAGRSPASKAETESVRKGCAVELVRGLRGVEKPLEFPFGMTGVCIVRSSAVPDQGPGRPVSFGDADLAAIFRALRICSSGSSQPSSLFPWIARVTYAATILVVSDLSNMRSRLRKQIIPSG